MIRSPSEVILPPTTEIWYPGTNPMIFIQMIEDAFKNYQREELNDDQARCWGMIKDLFLYRINKLLQNNLFFEKEVKKIGDNLAGRCESLFSLKEYAFDNCEKIRLMLNSLLGINIEINNETSVIDPDYIAPDGSQIFLVSNHVGYGLARCMLPQGAISIPASHKTVTEVWTLESGKLEIYLNDGKDEGILFLTKGDQCEIYPNTHFQFRTIGEDPLSVLIRTSPVWPGAGEVMDALGPWTPEVYKR